MLDVLRPKIEPMPNLKFSYNVGALLDIQTGKYLKGKHGESILNGGVSNITGVVGVGNTFKSTIAYYLLLTMLARYEDATGQIYDTEVNISDYDRIKNLCKTNKELSNIDLIESGRLLLTDKSMIYGNVWFEKQKDFMNNKIKNIKSITKKSPFTDREDIPIPTVTLLDSLTKFETEKTNSMQEDNELGDSDANTLYMKEGQDKKRLINSLVVPVQISNNPFILTAHVSKNINMDPRATPERKLHSLKNNDVIKGVTTDFTFLTTNCWQCFNSKPLLNDSTKQPEYPKSDDEYSKNDPDLLLISLLTIRSKTGMTGIITEIIVSQSEGVLPSLTEFHYIKTNDRFGIEGTLQHYNLELLPDVKVSRTTIRNKIDENYKLRRAINITSELCQIKFLLRDVPKELLCTPKQLYEDLKNKGYDWDVLLNTRGWWTYDNDKHPIPFLSTMDLMRMRLPETHENYYFPYWLEKDKKTIKKIKLEKK